MSRRRRRCRCPGRSAKSLHSCCGTRRPLSRPHTYARSLGCTPLQRRHQGRRGGSGSGGGRAVVLGEAIEGADHLRWCSGSRLWRAEAGSGPGQTEQCRAGLMPGRRLLVAAQIHRNGMQIASSSPALHAACPAAVPPLLPPLPSTPRPAALPGPRGSLPDCRRT